VEFEDPERLRRVEAGLLDADDQEPQEVEVVALQQGMLEGSNVQGMEQITHMIEVHRAYESVQQMIESESERQRRAISVLSGAKNA